MLIPILIPAAGAARRMRGADKLLEPVGGAPLLRRQAQLALATGQPVLVTLPVPEGARGAALAGLDLTRLPVPDAAEGMAASLRTGIAARPSGAAGVLILLADMPEIEVEDLHHLLETFAADPTAPILRASGADGTPGHPVLFPADLLGEFAQVTGDTGARAVIGRHPDRLRLLPLPGARATTDLDTPEAWLRWRAAHPEM